MRFKLTPRHNVSRSVVPKQLKVVFYSPDDRGLTLRRSKDFSIRCRVQTGGGGELTHPPI
jgi:hypothetical protein